MYSFPSVPSNVATFQSQNLSSRPTFFGCNDSAARGSADYTPLVIYLANGAPPRSEPGVFVTNTSTTQLVYPQDEAQAFLRQAGEIATQGFLGDGQTGQYPSSSLFLALEQMLTDYVFINRY